MFKTSNLLFLVTISIFIFGFVTYKLVLKNLTDNNQNSEKIIFSDIQRKTDSLLNKLLFNYSQEKDILLEKHKIVLDYLNTHSYDAPLDEIYKIINSNSKDNPYNIYITDKNLIIKNTTFAPDLNFNLNFAKDLFDNHKKANIIGVSAPVFETYSIKFFSFTDSYLPKEENKRLLQVSYRYKNIEKELKDIQKIIDLDKNIINSTAYVLFEDGYVGDFIFKSFKSYKPTLEEINKRINDGRTLENKLKEKEFLVIEYIQDTTKYKLYYFLGKSPIYSDAKIIYSVIFDQTNFKKDLLVLNIIAFSLMVLMFIVVFIIYKIKIKENLLNYKDKFIEHAVHEIKTPLSVIKLNNQLREKKVGEDKYSQKIEAAIKTLQNSYEDMTFLHTKSHIIYEVETLDLAYHLKHRVKFFDSIAQSQLKKIILEIRGNCFIDISKIELDRLIDNNLSNAIKYSDISSEIKITLENNVLKFINNGNKITSPDNILKKYARENNIQGGHGLGLSIVKSICDKYNISIYVESLDNLNTFSYKFNCHAIDTKKN